MDHMYASILPYEKYATSKYYYPGGSIRKAVINKEGRGIAEKRYHPNGYLHYDIVQNTVEKKKTIIDWFTKNILEQDNGYWFNGMHYQPDGMQIMNNAKLNGKNVYEKDGKMYEAYSDKEIADALSKNFIEPEKIEDLEIIYLSVCDSLGNRLLDAQGNGTEKLYDEVRQSYSYRTYVNYQMSESFYISKEGNKVYQYCDHPIKVRGLKA